MGGAAHGGGSALILRVVRERENFMSQAAIIPADVRERIHQLAALLYEQHHQQCFPVLADVCRLGGVDMNVASQLFMEWRMSQQVNIAPLPQRLPGELKELAGLVVDRTWQQAQQLANQYVQSAQAAWQDERQELLAEQRDLALLCEQQAQELDAVRQHLSKALLHDAAVPQPAASQWAQPERAQDELLRRLQRELAETRQALAESEQALCRMREQAQPAPEPLPPDDQVATLQQEVHALRSRLAQAEQQADQAGQQQLQGQEAMDALQHQLGQMQEELRTLRSDKESAYRAVANLRQQLQQLKQIKQETPQEEEERLARLKALAFSPSLPSQLAPDAEPAEQIWKAR